MRERPPSKQPMLEKLLSELENVTQQLEIADGDENQMERFFRREELLEQQDQLQAQIDEIQSIS